jgi:hypothetical protein
LCFRYEGQSRYFPGFFRVGRLQGFSSCPWRL